MLPVRPWVAAAAVVVALASCTCPTTPTSPPSTQAAPRDFVLLPHEPALPVEGEAMPQSRWRVQGGSVGAFIDGRRGDEQVAKRVWHLLTELATPGALAEVREVGVLPPETGAAVVPNVHGSWNVEVAPVERGDIRHILVHELMHLHTTRAEDTVPSPVSGRCETVPLGYGCAAPGSVYAKFTSTFWPQYFAGNGQDVPAVVDVGVESPDRFVSRYACRHPAEDISETFRHLVFLGPGAADAARQQGRPVVAQKFELLMADEEVAAAVRRAREVIAANPMPEPMIDTDTLEDRSTTS